MKDKTIYPLVSIIIPSYNHEKYIAESISSVLCQTYSNIEIIIIDDGSTDSSREIIENLISLYPQFNIKYYVQENRGLSKTLNRGLGIATGHFVGFIASDDAYLPDKIKENVTAFELSNDNISAVYSDGYIINSKGDHLGIFSTKYPIPIGKNVYKELFVSNWISAQSVLYKKDCLLALGGFDENLETEDYDLFIRFSKRFIFKRLKMSLFLYRWHGQNTSSDLNKMAEQRKKIMRKHYEMGNVNAFANAIMKKDLANIIKYFSMNSLDHLFRKIVRKIQYRFNIMNVGYLKFTAILTQRLLEIFFKKCISLILRVKSTFPRLS